MSIQYTHRKSDLTLVKLPSLVEIKRVSDHLTEPFYL